MKFPRLMISFARTVDHAIKVKEEENKSEKNKKEKKSAKKGFF